ncbi:TIGR03364 family FAD-dependent oxidoreductase [Flavihumibacter sp. UBA7668]|uniref:TIGR03364 family FAD-dependent oxidoreductase n=1 Tax=Flavihumibacter sp. UBA7668 TaxID=1946542 RepID=UPI0025BA11CC|nr:TIGR03364 family FAD-dependent oxidoreductase [Flavihumibacter sp. UBA7668]
MQATQYDLIVIGAGALGTFHAYHAAKRGWKVLLLEKDEKPSDATVRNFGMVIPSGMSQGKWKEHGRRSMEIYKSIQAEFDITVRSYGSVYLASNQTECILTEELATLNEQEGYPCEMLSKEDCLVKYPGLRASYCQGGLFFPGELTVEPRRMIHHLIAYLREQYKLSYKPNTLVKSIEYKTDRCWVETSGLEKYSSTHVILCSGREFKLLYPHLFAKSAIEVSKLQMLQTTPMQEYVLNGAVLGGLSIRRYESFRECPSYEPLQAGEIDTVFKKWGIHVLFKQAQDGSIIIGDSHEYADVNSTDALGYEYKQVIEDIILQEAQRMFRFPHWNIARQWNGFYAQCKEKDIFHHQADTNVQIITAIGGKGMTASASLAESTIQKLFN